MGWVISGAKVLVVMFSLNSITIWLFQYFQLVPQVESQDQRIHYFVHENSDEQKKAKRSRLYINHMAYEQNHIKINCSAKHPILSVPSMEIQICM